jgi:hypothetical protein
MCSYGKETSEQIGKETSEEISGEETVEEASEETGKEASEDSEDDYTVDCTQEILKGIPVEEDDDMWSNFSDLEDNAEKKWDEWLMEESHDFSILFTD